MQQFYFLSIVLNLLTGYALFSIKAEPRGTKFDGVRELLSDSVFRLVIGVLGATIGFLKLLTVGRGEIPIIGDLFPALTGMAAGFTLLLEFYRNNTSVTTDLLERLDRLFINNARILGILTMVSALTHFLFHNVILL